MRFGWYIHQCSGQITIHSYGQLNGGQTAQEPRVMGSINLLELEICAFQWFMLVLVLNDRLASKQGEAAICVTKGLPGKFIPIIPTFFRYSLRTHMSLPRRKLFDCDRVVQIYT